MQTALTSKCSVRATLRLKIFTGIRVREREQNGMLPGPIFVRMLQRISARLPANFQRNVRLEFRELYADKEISMDSVNVIG